jgi:hypothetical protein
MAQKEQGSGEKNNDNAQIEQRASHEARKAEKQIPGPGGPEKTAHPAGSIKQNRKALFHQPRGARDHKSRAPSTTIVKMVLWPKPKAKIQRCGEDQQNLRLRYRGQAIRSNPLTDFSPSVFANDKKFAFTSFLCR